MPEVFENCSPEIERVGKMSATATTVDEPDRSALTSNGVTELSRPSGKSANDGEVIEIEMKNSANGSNTEKSVAKPNWVKFDDDDNGAVAMKTNLSNAAAVTSSGSAATVSTAPAPAQNITPTTLAVTDIDIAPAVLATESTHVNLSSSAMSAQKPNTSSTSSTIVNDPPKNTSIAIHTQPPMRTIELSTGRIREGFANGDVIVTLLPTNTKWPWVTPAVFRPELVPEELMAQGLTLTVEEYVNAMETLVNDYRFTVYNICYKRILICWILFAFCVLLTLLFSGLQGIALFSLGVGWLFLNAAAIFLCMWMKLRLSRGLEKCLARVNKQLVRHKILLVLDDRGRISCHKVNLCFLYFDPAQCVAYLNEYLERSEQNGTNIQSGWEAKLDLDVNDIVIQGSNPMRLSRKQAIAQEIILSYMQRWGKDFLRRRLDWTVNEAGVHETPRHLMSSICPCQYVEEILNNKIIMQSKTCCFGLKSPFGEYC